MGLPDMPISWGGLGGQWDLGTCHIIGCIATSSWVHAFVLVRSLGSKIDARIESRKVARRIGLVNALITQTVSATGSNAIVTLTTPPSNTQTKKHVYKKNTSLN